jgi:2,4-dienoyl-CoA reductase-like NADH-dependent reductase (Old Yellow Enzyme family)
MITEATLVSADGHGYPNTPGIYTDEQMAAWKQIVKAVKDKCAVFFCQIWHCGRASHSAYQEGGAHLPRSVAASVRTQGHAWCNAGHAPQLYASLAAWLRLCFLGLCFPMPADTLRSVT